MQARSFCWSQTVPDGHRPGELASIHSRDEADKIASRLEGEYNNYWIGLSRVAGIFAWADSSAYDFEFWSDGEPNSNLQDGADCVEVYPTMNARWNDESCTQTWNEFICMTDKRRIFNLIFIHNFFNFMCLVPQTTNNPSTTPATSHQDTTPGTTKSTDTTPRTTKTTSWTDPWTDPGTTKSTPTQPNGETTVATPSKREREQHRLILS